VTGLSACFKCSSGMFVFPAIPKIQTEYVNFVRIFSIYINELLHCNIYIRYLRYHCWRHVDIGVHDVSKWHVRQCSRLDCVPSLLSRILLLPQSDDSLPSWYLQQYRWTFGCRCMHDVCARVFLPQYPINHACGL
jgi:hypothetical protein